MKQLVWRARGAAAGAHAQPLADVLDVLNRLVPVLVLLQGCLLRNLGRVRSSPLLASRCRKKLHDGELEGWRVLGSRSCEVVALASSSIVSGDEARARNACRRARNAGSSA